MKTQHQFKFINDLGMKIKPRHETKYQGFKTLTVIIGATGSAWHALDARAGAFHKNEDTILFVSKTSRDK